MDLRYESLLIGGNWVPPSSTNRITAVSASTEEVLGSVPEAQLADADAAGTAARAACDDPSGWSRWAPAERAAVMERLADVLEQRAEETVQRVSAQNGMPVAVGKQLEGAFPSVVLRYYASLVKEDSFEELRPGLLGGTTLVRREPVGVVAAIVPWNYPQTLAAFKYAPAMASGCTVVIKPSPETVLDSFLLAEAALAAGVPAGVLNIVPGGGELGARLVTHPGVVKVAFTGSTDTGRTIGEACGRLLRPVTLELGGKSAAIVLDDADLDLATIGQQLFASVMINNGQTCYAGTRVLAPQARYAEVVDVFTAFAESLKVGDPLEPDTLVGPMVSARQRDRVEGYIAKGLGEGARLTTGGKRPADLDRGYFVQPTVFADVDNDHTIAREEIFGPVLSIISYTDDNDAVRIANDSEFGLGGTVWTTDHDRGVGIAKQVRTGTIGINNYVPDPTAPFGGMKASGLGRELGPEGLTSYQQLKSVYL